MAKKNIIKETIEELEGLSKILKEAYVFDGAEEELEPVAPEEEYVEDDEMPMEGQTDDIVDQIRKLALDGIQKYAEDVDNEMYILFKKVWMMCDKCLSEKDKVEE